MSAAGVNETGRVRLCLSESTCQPSPSRPEKKLRNKRVGGEEKRRVGYITALLFVSEAEADWRMEAGGAGDRPLGMSSSPLWSERERLDD